MILRIFFHTLLLGLVCLFVLLVQESGYAAEPWSPQAVHLDLPAVNATAFTAAATAGDTKFKAPAYQDSGIENALDTGDYARAQKLINSRILNFSGVKNSLSEAYLHTTLMEALIWQSQLSEASSELKKVRKILDSLTAAGPDYTLDDIRELKGRSFDDQAWLLEGQGNKDQAQESLSSAISLLKELHAVDRQTWRLVACLSHSAALKAAAGDLEGARKLLEDALLQASGSHSISPLNVADVQESLGSVLYLMGKQQDSSFQFGRAIQIKNATGAAVKPYAPGPYWLSPNYRYIEGSPWSAKSSQNGLTSKKVDLGFISVEVGVLRYKAAAKQAVQVMVNVQNRTSGNVEFMGRRPIFLVLTPRASLARLVDPSALAAEIQKKGDGKAKWIRFWGQDASQSITTTYMGNMPFYGYGYGGAYPPVIGYGGSMPVINKSGDMTKVTTNVPDPIAQARALAKAQQVQAVAHARAEDIRAGSLGPGEITAGQSLRGNIFFDAPGLAQDSSCLVRIPIGDSQFEFRFDNLAAQVN